MHIGKFLSSLRALTVLPVLLLCTSGAQSQKSSYILVSAPLSIEHKTEIPGRTLEPGSYSIRIVDRLRDRFILRIDNRDGVPLATFIALHNPEFEPGSSPKQHGLIMWPSAPRGQAAVRGFSFPNGNTLEFVYPKSEAVALASLNTNSVPAIDPESEGRKADPKLSLEDREVVTLWMLSATRVGPKDETPAIAAKRFVASDDSTSPAPVEAALSPVPAPQARPASVQLARLEPTEAPRVHASVRRLPQTASTLPLTLLIAFLALFVAASLRLARTRA